MSNKIDFNFKTILITGGAGFIGSNIAFYLQQNYPNSIIVIFDCFRDETLLSNGNPKSLGHYKNLIGFCGEVICGNINNKSDLRKLDSYKFDFIFHQAAISDTRVKDQELIMRTNINAFHDLLEISKKNRSVMVYASSAATYGNIEAPQKIGLENPDNPYGYSKYVMDKIALKYSQINPELVITGLRYFNVYGQKEFYKGTTASMVIQLAHQILDGKKPRLFEGSKKIMRDFIHINDVVKANINACSPKENGIYNIGTGVSRSFQDIADILQKELNTNFSTEYFKNPFKGYQNNTQADIKLSEKNLNFKPSLSLESGIKEYLPEIIKIFDQNNND